MTIHSDKPNNRLFFAFELYFLSNSAFKKRLFHTLETKVKDECNYGIAYISNAKDFWLRDFMPVKTGDGRYVSFRYEPSYHKTKKDLDKRTVYKRDLEKEVKNRFGIEVE